MIYQYQCQNCNHDFDTVQSIHDEALTKCPKCKRKKLQRVIHSPYIINHTGEVKTIYHQAERNTKKLGKYELQAKEQEANKNYHNMPKTQTPWWREGTKKPIDLKKIKNTKKYIETGDKN